jgi:hypothetical protein
MSNTPNPGSGGAAPDEMPCGEVSGKSPIVPASVNLTVNGRARTMTLEPRMTLLDALREGLALTGWGTATTHPSRKSTAPEQSSASPPSLPRYASIPTCGSYA